MARSLNRRVLLMRRAAPVRRIAPMRPVALLLALLCLLPAAAQAQATLEFGTFHARVVQGGLDYSQNLLDHDGRTVELFGYMAPPLKPRVEWFMLTRYPMETCPYCSDGADWPPDVVLVLVDSRIRLDVQPFDERIRVVGTLELGLESDVEAGISLIRLVEARVSRAR